MAEGRPTMRLDPSEPAHISVVGRKGTGKSKLASLFWKGWPKDALSIDPTGDAEVGEDVTDLTDPLPERWPQEVGLADADPGRRRRPSKLHYKPDPGSDSYTDDLDRAVQLAFGKGDALLWIDEVGELTKANATPPAMRRLLHQSRHRRLSLLACGPRPVDIDPMVLSQADHLGIFHTPNPRDRQRLADTMGVEIGELEDAHGDLDEHGFLWWDSASRELLVMPPLPLEEIAKQERELARFRQQGTPGGR